MPGRAKRRARVLLVLAAAACADAGGERTPDTEPAALEAPAAVVDSARTIAEELARFREGLPPVETLDEGAAHGRAELVRRFVTALSSADTAAFRDLDISRTEFAYLYYPHTVYTRPPYELPPGLLWFQLQQNSEKGIVRALRRFGGRPLELVSWECAPEPAIEGPNRIWSECTLEVRSGTVTARERFFGSILERAGRYKFLSYSNDM